MALDRALRPMLACVVSTATMSLSTSSTVIPGQPLASASPTAPLPQPRSRTRSGGGRAASSARSSADPSSRRLAEKRPQLLVIVSAPPSMSIEKVGGVASCARSVARSRLASVSGCPAMPARSYSSGLSSSSSASLIHRVGTGAHLVVRLVLNGVGHEGASHLGQAELRRLRRGCLLKGGGGEEERGSSVKFEPGRVVHTARGAGPLSRPALR